jgi:hypothetical protein
MNSAKGGIPVTADSLFRQEAYHAAAEQETNTARNIFSLMMMSTNCGALNTIIKILH